MTLKVAKRAGARTTSSQVRPLVQLDATQVFALLIGSYVWQAQDPAQTLRNLVPQHFAELSAVWYRLGYITGTASHWHFSEQVKATLRTTVGLQSAQLHQGPTLLEAYRHLQKCLVTAKRSTRGQRLLPTVRYWCMHFAPQQVIQAIDQFFAQAAHSTVLPTVENWNKYMERLPRAGK